jgi:hypothetical protein
LAAHKQYVKSADDGKDPQLTQVLLANAPVAAEYVPAGQLVPAEAPAAAEYVPAGQSAHTEAPSVEYLQATQLKHELTVVAAVFPEYLPAGQSVHAEALRLVTDSKISR